MPRSLLVGVADGEQPRLGESLDPAGPLQPLQLSPEFEECYYEERWTSVFGGEYGTAGSFGRKLVRTIGPRMLGYRSPPEFIHMDRIGFDRALFERVAASEYCTRIESRVEAVDYDQQTDTIERLDLEDGETIRPEFVFDCTNHVRLLGRSLDLPVEWLGEPQPVGFTDYHTTSGGRLNRPDRRTMAAFHGPRAVLRRYGRSRRLSLGNPPGSYISVGISRRRSQVDLGVDTGRSRVEDAYRRRGMDFLEVFDDPEPAVTVPHQQYVYHDRAFGRNWLLAGPSMRFGAGSEISRGSPAESRRGPFPVSG